MVSVKKNNHGNRNRFKVFSDHKEGFAASSHVTISSELIVLITGEIHELREELVSNDALRRKEAVKKVIAAMTVGKDVSSLLTQVVNCIQTPNIEVCVLFAVDVFL